MPVVDSLETQKFVPIYSIAKRSTSSAGLFFILCLTLFISPGFARPLSDALLTKPTPLPMPRFDQCRTTLGAAPILPEKWQSGVLLMHYDEGRLVAGNIIQDTELGAQRFTLAGIEQGSGDYLLAPGGKLYQLFGGLSVPNQCRYLKQTALKLNASDFLNTDEGICVGEAEVLGKSKNWWKTKGSWW